MKKKKKYNYMNLSQETIDRINKAIDKSLDALEDIPDPFDNQVSEDLMIIDSEGKKFNCNPLVQNPVKQEKPRCTEIDLKQAYFEAYLLTKGIENE